MREGTAYHGCERCDLLFADPSSRLGPREEQARYASHRNDPRDEGYRSFLSRLADPLLERVPVGARGLDYGSGPGPTLSRILSEAGRPTVDYDPFFAPDEGLLQDRYDFVTCSETAEHFFAPGREFERIDALLEPGGWLGLMTGLVGPETDLATWWYLRDPTHVSFYSRATLEWIAGARGWILEPISATVALFRKPEG